MGLVQNQRYHNPSFQRCVGANSGAPLPGFPTRGKLLLESQLRGDVLVEPSRVFRNAHGYGRVSSDYGCVAWIADVPGLTSRLWSRNENQLIAMQFAPTAYIAIAEFKEKDWTVMLVMPIHWWDRSLPGIDLNERTGANDGV